MYFRFLQLRVLWLGVGIAIGLTAASLWPRTPLHATATDRTESFAICTGSADGTNEAVFTLDFLTGELSGAVVNPTTRSFTATYKRNIMSDLKVEPGRNPKYVMCTGLGDLRPVGNMQFGSSFVYVAEVTTGMMGIYAFPFNVAIQNNNRGGTITSEFIPLQVVPIRQTAVRQ
ncbi:MAG TPA: hypothetical protein VHV77_10945 [Pirellulales bacterium]|nr:hypothetical protein [Pirellulales bacterium]